MIVAIAILITAVIVGMAFPAKGTVAWGIGVAVLVMAVAFVGTLAAIAAFSLVLSDAGVFEALGEIWDGFARAVIVESGPVILVLFGFFVGYCGLGMLGVWLGKKMASRREMPNEG